MNEFGVPTEPKYYDTIVAYDWQKEPIYEDDTDEYFNLLGDYVIKDEIAEYIDRNISRAKMIKEWLE